MSESSLLALRAPYNGLYAAQMTELNSIASANRILEREGFLVCAFLPGPLPLPKPGDTVPGPIQGIPGPFAVVGTATREDFVGQSRRYSSAWWVLHVVEPRAAAAVAFFKLAAE